MQIIHNTEAVFDVSVNPFLQEIAITHVTSGESVIWRYIEIDEWYAYPFGEIVYDFHLLYDDLLDFSIYYIGEYNVTIPHNLHIEF